MRWFLYFIVPHLVTPAKNTQGGYFYILSLRIGMIQGIIETETTRSDESKLYIFLIMGCHNAEILSLFMQDNMKKKPIYRIPTYRPSMVDVKSLVSDTCSSATIGFESTPSIVGTGPGNLEKDVPRTGGLSSCPYEKHMTRSRS